MTNKHQVNDRTISYINNPGSKPGVFVCTGLGSHLGGTKATAITKHCAEKKIACAGLDYSGHGVSSGEFMHSTLDQWLEEALAIFDLTEGKRVIYGASMGFWIATYIALKRKDRVAGLLGVGAAVDFHRSFPVSVGPANLKTMCEKGWVEISPGWAISKPQYDSCFKNSLLDKGAIQVDCPIRLIHGALDPTISPLEAISLPGHYTSENITSTLVKDGDHNLLRPTDVAFILQQLGCLLAEVK